MIIGFGYDNAQLKELRHPTREELDAVSGGLPVLIVHQSGHLGVANSRALELAGITASSEADTLYGDGDPDSGDANERAKSGVDTIDAGGGDDMIFGGPSNDLIKAGAGNDTVRGGAGNDEIFAGLGDDIVYGDEVLGSPSVDSSMSGSGTCDSGSLRRRSREARRSA